MLPLTNLDNREDFFNSTVKASAPWVWECTKSNGQVPGPRFRGNNLFLANVSCLRAVSQHRQAGVEPL